VTVAEASESARRNELPARATWLFTGRGLASHRVVLAWLKKTGAEPPKANGNGGAIALGLPLRAIGTVRNSAERAGTGQLRHRRRSPLSDRSYRTRGQLH